MFVEHEGIIGPNPCPEPPRGKDTLLILGLALAYLAFLILTKGVDVNSAFAMASRRFGISETVLRKAARRKRWK